MLGVAAVAVGVMLQLEVLVEWAVVAQVQL
jgi:hypothetical protein